MKKLLCLAIIIFLLITPRFAMSAPASEQLAEAPTQVLLPASPQETALEAAPTQVSATAAAPTQVSVTEAAPTQVSASTAVSTQMSASASVLTQVSASATAPTQVSTPAPVEFSDVNDTDWFYPYIDLLRQKNLVKGVFANAYLPNDPLMIDEFLAFTLRTMGRDQENAEGYWALNYIEEAIRLNLIEPDEFPDYNVPITREKIAKIVVLASDYDFVVYKDYDEIFSDFALVSEKEYVLKAIELGVLAGYDDGTFRPGFTATRAEASAMVVRMIDPDYRLELHGSVFFNTKLDLNEDGNVRKEKAYDFVMESIRRLRLEKMADGRVKMTGYIPEVPDGQYFSMKIEFYNEKGKIIDGSYMTKSASERLKLPSVGEIEIITDVPVSEVSDIMAHFAVINSDVYGYTANFSIYRDYKFPERNFFQRQDYVRIVKYDYELTEGIWGW